MASLKPLIMRANRLLGASLVEQGLVSIDDLDKANERLRELMESNINGSQVGLLAIILITERVEVAFDCSQFTELRIAKWAPAASVEMTTEGFPPSTLSSSVASPF